VGPKIYLGFVSCGRITAYQIKFIGFLSSTFFYVTDITRCCKKESIKMAASSVEKILHISY
jgi:hypothetical protein